MFNGSNCDRKSQLSGRLTEPLNPLDVTWQLYEIFVWHFAFFNTSQTIIFKNLGAVDLTCLGTSHIIFIKCDGK